MRWLILAFLLSGCGDTFSCPCNQGALPSSPAFGAVRVRVVEGDSLFWEWRECPEILDCTFCDDKTEVWAWTGCAWVYVETRIEVVRCHAGGDD